MLASRNETSMGQAWFQRCLDSDLSLSFYFRILFIHEKHTHTETQAEGESRLFAGGLMWDLISGPQDHDLNQRQIDAYLPAPGCPWIQTSSRGAPYVAACHEGTLGKMAGHTPTPKVLWHFTDCTRVT